MGLHLKQHDKTASGKDSDGRDCHTLPFLEEKERYFKDSSIRKKKAWYYRNYDHYKLRIRIRRACDFLIRLNLPKYPSFLRWILVDFLRAKQRRFWGVYQFVALPGEGKTISMVAHMERVRASDPDVIIGTNFNYARQQFSIEHWIDIVKIAKYARKRGRKCIVAVDEIHTTFDSSDWRSFPPELLALLSFNRKFSLQFLCSAQIYERIPKKVRDIANYTVICKNVWGMDRLFRSYYFTKADYDERFDGKRKSAEFIRDFIADDDLYSLYDTLEQVDRMTEDAKQEKDSREQALEILFGPNSADADADAQPPGPAGG